LFLKVISDWLLVIRKVTYFNFVLQNYNSFVLDIVFENPFLPKFSIFTMLTMWLQLKK
jgi:hypothetical protein